MYNILLNVVWKDLNCYFDDDFVDKLVVDKRFKVMFWISELKDG